MNEAPKGFASILLAEGLGTMALLAIVVGSGIMGEQLSGGNTAIALLANSFATGFGLYVLISIFGPISGAHFNPLVSLHAAINKNMSWSRFFVYGLVQVIAAMIGVMLAHAMFDLPLLQSSQHVRTGFAQWLSEVVASAGLLITIVLGMAYKPAQIAALVGSYIAAAYWFTASTSFANPAVTLARSFTNTFAGIAPNDVLGFVMAQLVGLLLAMLLLRGLERDQRD